MTDLARLTTIKEIVDTDEAIIVVPHNPPFLALPGSVFCREPVFVD